MPVAQAPQPEGSRSLNGSGETITGRNDAHTKRICGRMSCSLRLRETVGAAEKLTPHVLKRTKLIRPPTQVLTYSLDSTKKPR